MSDKNLQAFATKKEMQEFVRQEVKKQTRGILRKSSASKENPGDFERLPSIQTNSRDSGVADLESILTPHTQETTFLLDSFEYLKLDQQIRNKRRLEYTADSLLDERVHRLKTGSRNEETRRFLNYNTMADIRSNMGAEYVYAGGEIGRNRTDLYCCYALYFFLVFCIFLFAIFYVWLPIINGILEGKPKANNSQFYNQNYNKYDHF